LLVASCDGEGAPRGSEPPRNFLLIVLDDVGVDKLALYGRHPLQPRTPHIDALASRGLRFDAAYAYSVCTPSRAALMTGRYTRRSGYGVIISVQNDADEIPLREVFVPEMLTGAPTRYASAAIGKWHMAGAASPSGFDHPMRQGFDSYAGHYGNIGHGGTRGTYFGAEKNVNGELVDQKGYVTTDSIDDAIAKLGELTPPWFLFVSLNAPHAPYHVPPTELTSSRVDESSPDADKYDAMIEAADTEIGRLLDAIPPNERERTSVILLSDNGTPSEVKRVPFRRYHGKKTLYEGGVRVPMIVVDREVPDPGAVRDQLVHVVDVFPTLAELAGVELRHPIDGLSFASVLRDAGSEPRRTVYSERFEPNGPPPYASDERMLRSRDFKLIRRRGHPDEFYTMRPGASDEGENLLERNLSPEEQAQYQALGDELDTIVAGLTYEGPDGEGRTR
jgi:arylsulfatase A-like enzyme